MKDTVEKTNLSQPPAACLGPALVCFVAFLVLGLGSYYMEAGEFVSERLAGIYALLSLVGAGAVLLRFWWFALPYYIGCALAWVFGNYVGAQKGEFVPAAGAITAAFALLGLVLQRRALRRRRLRRKEEQAREELKREAAAVTAAAAMSELSAEGSGEDGTSV